MNDIDALKRNRDAAFAAYLKVRKAGGRSKAKLAALIEATRAWHRAGGTVTTWQENIAKENAA